MTELELWVWGTLGAIVLVVFGLAWWAIGRMARDFDELPAGARHRQATAVQRRDALIAVPSQRSDERQRDERRTTAPARTPVRIVEVPSVVLARSRPVQLGEAATLRFPPVEEPTEQPAPRVPVRPHPSRRRQA